MSNSLVPVYRVIQPSQEGVDDPANSMLIFQNRPWSEQMGHNPASFAAHLFISNEQFNSTSIPRIEGGVA